MHSGLNSGLARSNRPIIRSPWQRRGQSAVIPIAPDNFPGSQWVITRTGAIGTRRITSNSTVNTSFGFITAGTDTLRTGLTIDNNAQHVFTSVSTPVFVITGTSGQKVTIPSDFFYTWSSTTSASGSVDTFLGREGPAVIQAGLDSATPVAQMFKSCDGVGTDKIGADLTIGAGRPTGAGTEGNILLQTAPAAGTSATPGTLATRLTINSTAVTIAPPTIHQSIVRLKGYTVATLPAGTQGDTAFCTDLLTPTFLTAAVGGGAIVGPVFYNGSAWVSY